MYSTLIIVQVPYLSYSGAKVASLRHTEELFEISQTEKLITRRADQQFQIQRSIKYVHAKYCRLRES